MTSSDEMEVKFVSGRRLESVSSSMSAGSVTVNGRDGSVSCSAAALDFLLVVVMTPRWFYELAGVNSEVNNIKSQCEGQATQ